MAVHHIAYKPLTKCSISELAAHQSARNRRAVQHTGGVMFARKDEQDTSPEKDAARAAIVSLLSLDARPDHVSVLSMPGLSWFFEAQVLKAREPNWRLQQMTQKVSFTCVENDRFIYYSAATKMPGNKHCLVRSLDRPEYAERAIGNGIMGRYVFANVDDLMDSGAEAFDFAWLDYTGPLTIERMKLIQDFWANSVRSTLVVTALKARWNRRTGDAVARHGGCLGWLRAKLPGLVAHEIEYQDGASPMVQFAVTKAVQA